MATTLTPCWGFLDHNDSESAYIAARTIDRTDENKGIQEIVYVSFGTGSRVGRDSKRDIRMAEDVLRYQSINV